MGDSNPMERYQNLNLKESLSKSHQYPLACKELGLFLRNAYSKIPKTLQSLIFQDTLSAFRLLPEMQTQASVSAANFLLQSAEAVLPKQKRALAVTEYKHAVVAYKRRPKSHQEADRFTSLPHDVLVHIFSFLDFQSLVSAAAVCRSCNSAASDNHLWQLLHVIFFGNSEDFSNHNVLSSRAMIEEEENAQKEEKIVIGNSIDWRDAFKKAYIATAKKFKSYRGYCWNCCSIVWLSSSKCSNEHSLMGSNDHQVKPLSMQQIVEYILDESVPSDSSSESDSDTDTDDGSIFKLWAYPRQIC
ncbi:F-box protein [Abeliophyllum distichum]|uniref:F-box protein n=1 Tax=Abeliophyllum distichum TaxID=126358 RepID=A0ABD1VSA0_9LAMI